MVQKSALLTDMGSAQAQQTELLPHAQSSAEGDKDLQASYYDRMIGA